MTAFELEIRVAAFEWLITRVGRSDEGTPEYRPALRVRHGSRVPPLKRMPTITFRTNAEKIFAENHSGTSGEEKKQRLPSSVVRRLESLWTSELRKKGAAPRKKTIGTIVFNQCTIWWDGKQTALICTGYYNEFDDKTQGDSGSGSALEMAALLTRRQGKWQVVESKTTLAAG